MGNAKYDQEFVNNAIEAFSKELETRLGIEKYLKIVNRDEDWKETYASFYGLNPIRSAKFKQKYFEYLEDNEDANLGFEEALSVICGYSGKTDLSFTTKLLHTIDPNKPIWDSRIERVIEERLVQDFDSLNMRLAKAKYEILNDFYNELIESGEAQEYINAFDERFKDLSDEELEQISAIKKIDFVLWAYGDKLLKLDSSN